MTENFSNLRGNYWCTHPSSLMNYFWLAGPTKRGSNGDREEKNDKNPWEKRILNQTKEKWLYL